MFQTSFRAQWFDITAFGNDAHAVGRAPGLVNFDMDLMKNRTDPRRVRGEAFSAFNKANFGAINSAADARILQVGLKLYF